tara:strand:+ start:739 stop:2421 length:1683 start_codon:yes stop_codon:yes gene_type:complete
MPIELFGFSIGKKEKKNVKAQTFAEPEYEDGSLTVASGGAYGTYVDTEGAIKSESELINRYRDMGLQAEVEWAIDDIINEAIVASKEKPLVRINVDNLNVSEPIRDKIRLEFKAISRLLDLQNLGHDVFKRWYVDGRIYYHVIVDENNMEKGIHELRVLDPRKIKKIREKKNDRQPDGKTKTTVTEYYVYNQKGIYQSQGQTMGTAFTSAATGLKISPDAIVYTHSGLMNSTRTLVLSYLHKAIKPLNQLRMIEDSLVIYRISRAPERRIFYVDVGNLPKLKAEQYMRDLMARYKNKLVYDAQTGEVRDDRKHMSMLEDYWMPRREGGRGTEISTLPGGTNLGDIEDVLYFQKKLYKSLGVPISRLESEANYTIGRATEISRDEVKFTRFVNKLQSRFSLMFDEMMERQLTLKGIMSKEDWKNIKNEIFYEFENDSHFAEVKQHELVQDRLNILRDMQDYAGKYWSHEYIRKHILMMTDDEVKTNDEQIQKEIDDPRFSGEEDMQFNSAEINTDNKQEINEDIDKKIEEKFEFAKKENDIKDKVNDILFSVLEDDEKFVD